MKNTKHFLALLLVALFVWSCDKDYNTIGSGLVNENHFDLKEEFGAGITTTQVNFKGGNGSVDYGVQTNNLLYNTLGFYSHPVYGEMTANVVSQVSLSEYGKDFGENPVITKVILSVPYFSTKTETDSEGEGTYELDSVYGGENINLKIYRSDYFLNDFNEEAESRVYYSNETLPGIENELLYEDTMFYPSNEEIDLLGETDDDDDERLSPRLWLESNSAAPTLGLRVSDFEWLIDPLNEEALSSASNFKNFYRGIFFKAEKILPDGVLMGLDLSKASIEVFHGKLLFEEDGVTIIDADFDGDQDIEDVGSIELLFNGKKVNFFDNNFAYTDVAGSKYLNGGQGAMVKVDLFTGPDGDGDGVSDKLEYLRESNILINEANLEFYVDQSIPMGGESESDRIFLYDIDNNKVLLDYQFDNTSQTNTNETQLNHLGRLEKDDSGYGVKYKIRVTEHITDLIKNDSTNVQLGLVVSNNVISVLSSGIEDSDIVPGLPEKILSSSVNSHKGTVLYDEDAVDEDKRLVLRIYYTEEDN